MEGRRELEHHRAVPTRIQLRRTKGWRKPAGVVVVSRPSRWGNPFRIGVDDDAARCVVLFREALENGELTYSVIDVRRELGGRELACWCETTDPGGQACLCHGDVLLDIANKQT
jgi:hypothetical protein